MSERTDTERLDWLLDYFFIGHDYGKSYFDFDGPWLPGGMKWFNKWETAAIRARADRQITIRRQAIDAAMDAEQAGEGE